MSGSLRIGELARLAGTTPRTVRYYEEIGLLRGGEERAAGSHRLYEQADVERVRDLLRLKDLLGISLEELREVVAAEDARAALRDEWHRGVEDSARRREILEEAAGHIDAQLTLLGRRRREIVRLERELRGLRRRVAARMESRPPGAPSKRS
ncbi:MAG: MerR family transcriptional regulator [Solirubrobacteraceae bacterium]